MYLLIYLIGSEERNLLQYLDKIRYIYVQKSKSVIELQVHSSLSLLQASISACTRCVQRLQIYSPPFTAWLIVTSGLLSIFSESFRGASHTRIS
jgi:hypothetical protein